MIGIFFERVGKTVWMALGIYLDDNHTNNTSSKTIKQLATTYQVVSTKHMSFLMGRVVTFTSC